ncbi:MAG: hypothetical protein U0T77_10640 [Chitinophagales bacterium]
MKEVTPSQIKKIHTILPAAYRRNPELKQSLVYQFTENHDKLSTKDLSFYQAEELIHFLETGKTKDYSYFAHFDYTNKQHMYMFSLCHQIGWEVFSESKNKLVVDIAALGSWLYKYGYKHKPLREYTYSELPKLITQFENLVKSKAHKS